MTFANLIKILLLVATVAQVVAGLNGLFDAKISAILAGVASAIFAFVKQIEKTPDESNE